MRLAVIVATLVLAGCGVDGPPVPPSQVEEEARTATGLTLSGSAEFGISGSF
jgi:predicted small lipoprotein YifL